MMAMQNGITKRMTTGMTRPAKHSLVLLFTILLSVFMCQGLYTPNEAQAAVTLVTGGAVNGSVNNGGNVTLTFPGGVQQGDVVILYGGNSYTGAAVAAAPVTAGYTAIAVSSSTGLSFGAWYKVMGATPDATVVGGGTGNGADSTTYGIYILRGVDAAIFDVARTTATGGAATPNPPSITTVTNGAWVLALAADNANDGTIGAVPTGYTNGATSVGNDTNDFTIAGATLEKAAFGLEDPGTWGTWSAGTVWYAITVAIRPQPCVRNAPTFSALIPASQTITTDGGSVAYTTTITNNDSAGCSNETFNFTANDSNTTNFNASGVSPTSVALAPGATSSTITLTVTGKTGQTSGTNISSVSAASANHSTVTTNNVTTTLSVCTRSAPSVTFAPSSGSAVPGGNQAYTVTVTNNDTASCSNSTFTVAVGNDTNSIDFTTPSTLGATTPSPCTLAPAGICTATLTVTAQGGATPGNTNTTTVTATDNTNHAAQQGSGNVTTTVIAAGPPTLNPDGIPAGTWTNEAGGALTPDKINDASDLTYAKTTTNGATFDASFSNDAAYSGKQIDNVRIYVRAYAAGEKIDWGPVIGGTPYLSGTQVTLTTTPTDYFKDWALNPQSGVNWTPAEVDALVARMSAIATGGMSEERVYKVWAVITYSEPVVSAINHNSTTTSSSKWPGNSGWGLAGTKYGEFVCATCHEPRATNIKSIKSAITAPSGSFPGGAGSPVNFQSYTTSATDMGNDSGNTPRASSTRICEVCHTYDVAGQSGVTAHPYSVGSALPDHKLADNTDCTGCHKHNKGFDASCDVCHGYPPTTTGAGGPTGLANDPGPTGSTTAGKHATHVTTLSFVCENCHFGYSATMPETPQLIDIGFSMWTKDGTGTSYTGHTETDGYRGRNGTSVASIDTNRTCNNLYCHGAFSGGLTAAPTWIGTAACGTCHANDAASAASLRASHTRHAGNAAGGISVACADCHNNGAVYTTVNGHVNGSVAWSLKTSDSRFGTNAKYNAVASGSTGAVAPSASYQTCTNLYCHSNVQSGTALAGPTSYGSPTWGAASVTCAEGATGCHGNPPATPTANTAHGTHTSGSYSFITCAACHNSAGDETTLHANGAINMTINTTYGGSYSQGDHTPGSGGYGTCSNVYCHGNFTGGLNASPAWNASIDCTTATCHNYTNATPPTNVNHPRHAGTGAGQLNLACTKCHPARASLDGHVDLSVQWDLDRTDAKFGSGATYRVAETGATGSKAPSASYGNCGTVYCHSSVQSNPGTGAPASYATPTWGAASVTCASCHGQGTASASGQPSTGSHERHVTGYSYACSVCHSGLGDEVATHANGTINLAFEAATAGGSATYTTKGTSFAPQSAAFQTCTTTFCHGDSTNTSADTGTWGTSLSASDACTVCHGTKTAGADGSATAYLRAPGGNATGVDTNGTLGTITRNVSNDTEVGAHDGHLRALAGISSAIACTECHAVPANTVAGIKGHLDGTPANMTWGTLATKGGTMTPAFDAGTHTCSTNRCHDVATNNHTTNATDTTPTWNDINYFGDVTTPLTATECNRCHYYSSATNCNGCHSHATSATPTVSFITPSLHINGTVESSGGTCTGCHISTKGTSPVRRATVGEFGQLHGHKKSDRGAITDADCYPCHWEANSNGTINTTYHGSGAGDGKIDLRDPDSTTLVINLGAGYQFSRDLSSATIEGTVANIQTFCLACHDADGSKVWVSGGSATNPWADGASVVNVETQFAITNTSFHPVLGAQNNPYCESTTMDTPWNQYNKAAAPTLTNGDKITCFDCHAKDGATGIQTSTIVAHGTNESDTVRASVLPAKGSATPLCVVCHKSAVYWGTKVHADTQTVSAKWGIASGRHDAVDHTGCTECHGNGNGGTWGAVATQAERAINSHGFNQAGRYSFLRMEATGWDPSTRKCGLMCGTAYDTTAVYDGPGGSY